MQQQKTAVPTSNLPKQMIFLQWNATVILTYCMDANEKQKS